MRFLLIILLTFSSGLYAQEFEQNGKASYYASCLEGRQTANGDIFSNNQLTAAHKSLPFGTRLVVTNLVNNKQVIVTINDRGPFIKGRIIDLSQAAAQKLGFINQGITQVKIEMAHQKLEQDQLKIPLKSKTICFNLAINIDKYLRDLR